MLTIFPRISALKRSSNRPILDPRNSSRRILLIAFAMSVTFFIPIMLAHACSRRARVCALAPQHTCMHVCIHVTVCAEGGGQGAPRGGREGEKGREKERNDGAARVPCEYNAEGTYRRFQRGIDGDLVAGNSPRLTPLSFPSPLHRRAARGAPLFLLLPLSVSLLPRCLPTSHIAVSFPSPPFCPAPQGGVIVSYTLPNNHPPPSPLAASPSAPSVLPLSKRAWTDTSDILCSCLTSRKRRNLVFFGLHDCALFRFLLSVLFLASFFPSFPLADLFFFLRFRASLVSRACDPLSFYPSFALDLRLCSYYFSFSISSRCLLPSPSLDKLRPSLSVIELFVPLRL